ncbi:MAG: metallophosphoesterase family protein [Anaerolineae bacterium]|nr:metallophosphoesterase family protein [Anaerolineae bacterium]
MRVALISDIHGNSVSLEAVLADIEQENVDQLICLGDLATLGPKPVAVMDRIRDLGCECILGNHDFFLINPSVLHEYMDAPWFADSIAWCAQQLRPEDFEFLHTFKPTLEIPLSETHNLLCFHGSPKSNTDIILAMTPPTTVDELLDGRKATVMAGGHTHMQMMRQHKGIMLINTGSVGMPFEQALFVHSPRYLPWAEYAIVNCEQDVVSVELKRVPVSVDELIEAANNSGFPDATVWMKNWMLPGDLL